MDLAGLFDSITVINAAHRADRRREMRDVLGRAGWDPDGPRITWFPAIDPKTPAGFASPGSRGCFLSHVAVLNIARAAGHRRVLVLEDDCDFAPDFPARQAGLAEALASDPWGIAYLGHIEPAEGPGPLVPWGPGSGVALTHCYAVAGEAIARLPRYLEALTLRPAGSPEGGPMSIDAGFSWFRRQNPDVRTVLVTPSLAHQRPSRSDLSPRWFDRLPVVREAAHSLRAWRRRPAHQVTGPA